ncbi:MAG: hypothetical protein KA604_01360 [Candidatus Saccharimonas sp.]|nr:hypothetical protein [Candidatus Saccharimonas sp.]
MTEKNDSNEIIRQLQAKCEEYIRELNKKEHKIATLSAHIDELTTKLNQQATIRAQARNLYNEIDNRIMTKLNAKGMPKKKPHKAHPLLRIQPNSDISTLQIQAYEYDIAEFFQYRRKQQKIHLVQPYRTIAKAYRISRDAGHKLASVGIRFAKKAK